MLAARGLPAVRERAPQPALAWRLVTAGHAGTAMVLHGVGLLQPPLSRVPPFCPHPPLARRRAPGLPAPQLHEATRGRALETLCASGGTARDRRRAAPAATRRGLAPGWAPLDRPRVPGAGRYHRAEEPQEHVMPSPRGSRRAQRPARTPVLRALMGAAQAYRPGLLTPRRGTSRAAQDGGPRSADHGAPGPSPSGAPCLGADRALDRAATLPQRAETRTTGSPRVPATWRDAQAVWAPAPPRPGRPARRALAPAWCQRARGGAPQGGRRPISANLRTCTIAEQLGMIRLWYGGVATRPPIREEHDAEPDASY